MKATLALLLAMTFLAGCLRTELGGSVLNMTPEAHIMSIILNREGAAVPVYNETLEIPGASDDEETVDLGTLTTRRGQYAVTASLDGGDGVSRSFEWARKTGPDKVVFRISADGLEIDLVVA